MEKTAPNHRFREFLDGIPFNTIELKKLIINAGVSYHRVHRYYNGSMKKMTYEDALIIRNIVNQIMKQELKDKKYRISDFFGPVLTS